MIEAVPVAAPTPVETPRTFEEVEPTGFGARLAWHRERAGLTVVDVASRLRLSANHVRAIEAENLGTLPAIAYVRGFIRGYARIVGIDPTSLLDDLSARLGSSDRAGAQRGEDRTTFAGPADGRVSRRIVLAAAVLVLVALGAIGWHTTSRLPVRSVVAESAVKVIPTAAVAPQAVSNSAAETIKPASETPAEPVADSAVAPASVVETAGDAQAPSAQSVAAVATEPPVAGPVSAAPASISLTFDGPCWVEITAADGKVVHSQLHPAGSQAEIGVPLPLSVVLGDGNNVRVAVRGNPFDIAPFMRQNVARFKIDR